MKKEDTRIQFTKSRFHDAMIDLLEQKPIGFVTVKELCDTAGLNRGTFYLHYSEPNDVLQEIENDLFLKTFGTDDPLSFEPFHSTLLSQMQVLAENRRVAAAVIGHNGHPMFLKSVHDRVWPAVRKKLESLQPGFSTDLYRAQFAFLFSGCTGIVSSWLNGHLEYSPEKMTELLSRFIESIRNTTLVSMEENQ